MDESYERRIVDCHSSLKRPTASHSTPASHTVCSLSRLLRSRPQNSCLSIALVSCRQASCDRLLTFEQARFEGWSFAGV